MTNEDIDLAIAGASGWKEHPPEEGGNTTLWMHDEHDTIYFGHPPRFAIDLNEMHRARKILTEDQQRAYAHFLASEDMESLSDPIELQHAVICDYIELPALSIYQKIIDRTAAQHAEAFLRTMKLWQE